MCTIAHTDAFLDRPTEDFERLSKEIKRLEGLVEGRDAEIERLSRGWDASLNEIERLKAQVQAHHTPDFICQS